MADQQKYERMVLEQSGDSITHRDYEKLVKEALPLISFENIDSIEFYSGSESGMTLVIRSQGVVSMIQWSVQDG
jgi:hypothetical protein